MPVEPELEPVEPEPEPVEPELEQPQLYSVHKQERLLIKGG